MLENIVTILILIVMVTAVLVWVRRSAKTKRRANKPPELTLQMKVVRRQLAKETKIRFQKAVWFFGGLIVGAATVGLVRGSETWISVVIWVSVIGYMIIYFWQPLAGVITLYPSRYEMARIKRRIREQKRRSDQSKAAFSIQRPSGLGLGPMQNGQR